MLSKKLFLSSVTFFVLPSLHFISSVGASSVMWSQTYEIGRQQKAYSLIETSDGGYAMAGNIFSFFTGEGLIWVAKTDMQGIIPEFPSWTPMFFAIITIAIVLVVYKRKLSKLSVN
jgi:hypothetical protein